MDLLDKDFKLTVLNMLQKEKETISRKLKETEKKMYEQLESRIMNGSK